MSTDPTSLAQAMDQIKWKNPISQTDAVYPLESSNPIVAALRWYILGLLGPAGVHSFRKEQTKSQQHVFTEEFPRTLDEIDRDMQTFHPNFKDFLSKNVELEASPLFALTSSKILGTYTAAMMKKCKNLPMSEVAYTRSGDLDLADINWAIEAVQSRAQHLFDHISQGPKRSAVLPKWAEAFFKRAADELVKSTVDLSDVDQPWVETIAQNWDVSLVGEEVLSNASETSDGKRGGMLSTIGRSMSVAGTSAVSYSPQEPGPKGYMRAFRQKLKQVDSLISDAGRKSASVDGSGIH